MIRACLVAAVAVLANACAPGRPHGIELDAGAALDVVLKSYASAAAHPPVFGVEANCSDMHDGATGFGFWLDDGCRGGFTDESGIYIVLHPAGARYSHNLAHEARHWTAGGDFDPGHKGAGFFAAVAVARELLAASPVDVVAVGVTGFAREGL